jgi:GAF domain-containing protein
VTQTPRDIAFCGYTILGKDLFEVTDAPHDRRFFDNPMVTGASNVRYYAGMPVSVGDYPLGALCVMDTRPRELSERERVAMVKLGRTVSSWLKQHYMRRADGEASSSMLRPWAPVEVSSNRYGGFHLSLRAH